MATPAACPPAGVLGRGSGAAHGVASSGPPGRVATERANGCVCGGPPADLLGTWNRLALDPKILAEPSVFQGVVYTVRARDDSGSGAGGRASSDD